MLEGDGCEHSADLLLRQTRPPKPDFNQILFSCFCSFERTDNRQEVYVNTFDSLINSCNGIAKEIAPVPDAFLFPPK